MPAALFKKYQNAVRDIAFLEGVWKKAKGIVADKYGDDLEKRYGLVTRIFQNMIGVKAPEVTHASVSRVEILPEERRPLMWASESKAPTKKSPLKSAPSWWTRKTPEAQRTYLKKHPGSSMTSILKKTLKPLKKAPGASPKSGKTRVLPSPVAGDMRPLDQVADDNKAAAAQAKVTESNASKPPTNPSPKERSIFRNLFRSGSKAVKGVYSAVRDATKGTLDAADAKLKAYSEKGSEEDPESSDTELELEGEARPEKKSVMGILGAVATATLVAGIGAGVFMVAPGLGPTLAEMYFNHRAGRSESSSGGLPLTVESLTKDFTDWLSQQDVEQLMARNPEEE